MSTISLRVRKRKARLTFENLLKLRWKQHTNYVPICERPNENPLDNLLKEVQ